MRVLITGVHWSFHYMYCPYNTATYLRSRLPTPRATPSHSTTDPRLPANAASAQGLTVPSSSASYPLLPNTPTTPFSLGPSFNLAMQAPAGQSMPPMPNFSNLFFLPNPPAFSNDSVALLGSGLQSQFNQQAHIPPGFQAQLFPQLQQSPMQLLFSAQQTFPNLSSQQNVYASNALRELISFNLNDPLHVEVLMSVERNGANNIAVMSLLDSIRRTLPPVESTNAISRPTHRKRKSELMEPSAHSDDCQPHPVKGVKKPIGLSSAAFMEGKGREKDKIPRKVHKTQPPSSRALQRSLAASSSSGPPSKIFVKGSGKPLAIFVHFELGNRADIVHAIKVKNIVIHAGHKLNIVQKHGGEISSEASEAAYSVLEPRGSCFKDYRQLAQDGGHPAVSEAFIMDSVADGKLLDPRDYIPSLSSNKLGRRAVPNPIVSHYRPASAATVPSKNKGKHRAKEPEESPSVSESDGSDEQSSPNLRVKRAQNVYTDAEMEIAWQEVGRVLQENSNIHVWGISQLVAEHSEVSAYRQVASDFTINVW
jgi:hypothetical protein